MVYDTDRLFPRHGTVMFFDELRLHAAGGDAKRAAALPDDDPRLARETLYTAVHELGHAFNLLHSFQKGWFGGSDVAPRPDSASWMNYPHLYPWGRMREPDQPDRFWRDFRFTFDRAELEHLRHHERDEVMMGADPFGALGDLVPGVVRGLDARVECGAAFDLGEPFPLALVLTNRTARRRAVTLPADPLDVIDVVVRRPDGGWRRFEPLVTRLETRAAARRILLEPGASHRVRVVPFYGRHGFTFDRPGTWLVRASLRLPGRAPIAAPPTALLVRTPGRELERLLETRLFGDEQGHFLTFAGGDHLARGRRALEELAATPAFARSGAAVPVRAALAASLARPFQSQASVRPARPAEAVRFLGDLAPRDLLARQAKAGPGRALRTLLESLGVLDAGVLRRIEEAR
jgi:hypothetical protein